MEKPGFGEPHPRLVTLLHELRPLATQRTAWVGGTMPLEVRGYAGCAELPDELITSVRCIVRVAEQIVLCTNQAGIHPWPGGRREPGESHARTALREVHEETGWRLDPATLRSLGWLQLRHLGPRRRTEDPYPDFLQLVLTATARERDTDPGGAWTDPDGHEQSSSLARLDDAVLQVAHDPIASAFLALLRR